MDQSQDFWARLGEGQGAIIVISKGADSRRHSVAFIRVWNCRVMISHSEECAVTL